MCQTCENSGTTCLRNVEKQKLAQFQSNLWRIESSTAQLWKPEKPRVKVKSLKTRSHNLGQEGLGECVTRFEISLQQAIYPKVQVVILRPSRARNQTSKCRSVHSRQVFLKASLRERERERDQYRLVHIQKSQFFMTWPGSGQLSWWRCNSRKTSRTSLISHAKYQIPPDLINKHAVTEPD